jgi:hypothetical protein
MTARYKRVAAYVLAGKQHDPSSTPIFIDEYNIGSPTPNCCNNSFPYAPLWNSLVITDLFNAVLTNTSSVLGNSDIARLSYFEVSDPPAFCLFGVVDAAMDCSRNGNIEPYPPFYTYQLVSNPQYLDMFNYGYLVSPVSIGPSGITAVGLYTQTKDNLLIVNTSATSYQQLKIAIQHPGNILPTASLYILNQQNPHIGTQTVTLIPATNGYAATADIPAYTTVALSLEQAIGGKTPLTGG